MDIMDKMMNFAGDALKKYGEKAIKSGIEKGIEYGAKKIGLQPQQQTQPSGKFRPAPPYIAQTQQQDYTNYLIIGGVIIGIILILKR